MHDIETGELGTWLALSSVAGGVGTFMGGYLSDKLGKQDPRWYQWVPAITTLIYLPFTLFIYLTDQTYLALMTTFITGCYSMLI